MTVDQRVTETRTEIRVEEVEDTRFECAVCEMVHDAEDVLTVSLDRQPVDETQLFGTRHAEVERILCTYCAEGLFDYSTAEGWTPERDSVLPGQFVERMTAYAIVGFIVSIPAAALFAVLAGAGVAASTAGGYAAIVLAVGMVVSKLL